MEGIASRVVCSMLPKSIEPQSRGEAIFEYMRIVKRRWAVIRMPAHF